MEAARNEVRRALNAVQDFVGTRTAKALAWKKFMLWDQQLAQLTAAKPIDVAFWQSVLRLETRDSPGLEHEAFRYHRAAVRELIDVFEASQNADLKAEYEKTLTELAAALPKGNEKISAERADKINRSFARLYRQGQAAELVQAIRAQYSLPNVALTIPASFVERMGSGDMDSEYAVNDVINGARVQGSGRLVGTRKFSLADDKKQGVLSISMAGTTDSLTQGYQDGVTVQTRSVLRFKSTSAVHMTPLGFNVLPFATAADLNNQILRISTTYGGRRDSEARSRVYGRRESDRREGERRATYRLKTSFGEEVAKQFQPAQDYYDEKVRNPLLRYDRFPDDVSVTSSTSQLRIRAVVATDYQLGAPLPMPAFGKETELKFAVHQSVFNHSTVPFLAGEKMSLQDAARRALTFSAATAGGASDSLQITFNDAAPLRVSFESGLLSIVLSGAAYQQGGQRYSGMDLALAFRPEQKDGKWWLVQARDPEVMLPKLPDGTRPKLGVRDYALRRILTNVIKRDVPARSELEMLKLPPPLDSSQGMAISTVLVRDGWFCMSAKEVK